MYRQVAALEHELNHCNKCGFCQAVCPTFRLTGMEWMVTRGRISLAQDLLAGRTSVADQGLMEAMDSCLMCGACLSACPPRVAIGQVVRSVRSERLRQKGLPGLHRLVVRGLLPRPGLLRLAARVGAMADRLGVRRLAAGRLGARFPVMARAAAVGPRLAAASPRAMIRLDPPAQPRARVAYFLPCTKELFYPESARATVQVLQANGVAVTLPPVACCGLPAGSAGDLEGARRLARQNLSYLEGLDVDAIVCDEGACTHHLHEYPLLLAGSPDEERAKRMQARLKDLSQFLTDLGPAPMTHRVTARVVWHDPCSLIHHMSITEPPRQLLRSIPGVTLVEAGERGTCCGGAGHFMVSQPELSDQLLEIKMNALGRTGAEYLVTASPSCQIQLERGARTRGESRGLKVLHLSEMLAMGYGFAGGGERG